jgi:hypothetical protein
LITFRRAIQPAKRQRWYTTHAFRKTANKSQTEQSRIKQWTETKAFSFITHTMYNCTLK